MAVVAAGLPVATSAPAWAGTRPDPGECRTSSEPGLLVLNGGCGLPTVVYAHAAGESVGQPLRPDVLVAVADAGYSVVMSDLCGPLNWGSACAVEELHRLVRSYSPDRPVRVLAFSMGGAGLLNYAEAYPSEVLKAVGVVPVTTWDTDWLRRATAGSQPPLPAKARFRYRIFSGAGDEVVGPPVLGGRRVSVEEVAGGHDAWRHIRADRLVKALG